MAKAPRPASRTRRAATPASPYRAAVRHLAASHPALARVVKAIGPCTIRPDPDLFAVLVRTVISQQISTKAARSIGQRLLAALGRRGLTPAAVLALADEALRAAGLSAAKRRSIRALAAAAADGTLDLAALPRMDDAAVRAALLPIHGIGPWSVDMILIFGLGRLDVLPVGDLGLRMGVKELYGLAAPPGPRELEELAEAWRPYRTIATWYFWRSRGFVPQSD
jgi:DNA-3-methyladenine glycosylase II